MVRNDKNTGCFALLLALVLHGTVAVAAPAAAPLRAAPAPVVAAAAPPADAAAEAAVAQDSVIPQLDCVIEPSEVVDVGSPVPGILDSVKVNRADFVESGAVVAELESGVERATLDLARTRAKITTSIELREEVADLGVLTQKRNQELYRKRAISAQDMDQLAAEARIAQLQVRQEEDNKRLAELDEVRAQAALREHTIVSPVNGVVMERFKTAGEFVEEEPVMRIAQIDPLHVEVIVPVDYLGRITPGMKATVVPGVPKPGAYSATVERVDRVADAASGTYGVRLTLANPKYAIPAGVRCRLDFEQ